MVEGGLGAKRRHGPCGGEGTTASLNGTWLLIWPLPEEGRCSKRSSGGERYSESLRWGGGAGFELETGAETFIYGF